ncbi:MAG: hypothetical protein ACI8S6_005070, partial [Myxococcota bacterium]
MLTLWLTGMTSMALANGSGEALEAWGHLDEPSESLRDLVESDGVVGGSQAEPGRWDDAAGIVFYSQYIGCTGVLIAPKLVLTAGHCVGGITHVLLGSTDYTTNQGDFFEVARTYQYGDVYDGVDIAVLLLEEEVPYEPRLIATDCIRDELLVDGGEVAVVGYGNTRSDGNGSTSKLNEGITYIQDADCSEDRIGGMYTGCNPRTPGGELAAGGNGVDACFGDSGGPLYLLTDRGDFLAGITSRAYAGASSSQPCLSGGIYGRPDYVLDWIEETTGEDVPRPQCNDAPDPTAARIDTGRNDTGETRIKPHDPDGESGEHTYQIVEKPRNGSARVNASGKVTYTPDRGYTGNDSLTVAVTDAGSPDYDGSGPITSDVDVR